MSVSSFSHAIENTYYKCSYFASWDMQRKVLEHSHARPGRVLETNILDVNDSVSLARPLTTFVERIDLRGSVDEGE
jgi:hypothetical protein